MCTASCGGGTRFRTRSCVPEGADCSGFPGPNTETASCNEHVS